MPALLSLLVAASSIGALHKSRETAHHNVVVMHVNGASHPVASCAPSERAPLSLHTEKTFYRIHRMRDVSGHRKVKHPTRSTNMPPVLQPEPLLHPVRAHRPLPHAVHASTGRSQLHFVPPLFGRLLSRPWRSHVYQTSNSSPLGGHDWYHPWHARSFYASTRSTYPARGRLFGGSIRRASQGCMRHRHSVVR